MKPIGAKMDGAKMDDPTTASGNANTPVKRKNPVLRTRQATLPPGRRGRTALGLTAAAARGEFALQVCEACHKVQYPPREACHHCLCLDLRWRPQSGEALLLSDTVLHHSNDLFYRERLPWRLGMVQLLVGEGGEKAVGPALICHVHCAVPSPTGPEPIAVKVIARLDKSGQAVLIATPQYASSQHESVAMADDPQLREMTCDPKNRKILVTDAKSALGQAMVKACVTAGAEIVWAGQAEPWKRFPGMETLENLPSVTWVPLDVTDERSVNELAGEIGGKVDIVINTAELHRSFGIAARRGTDVARAEMDINYFGLLRLAQAFGPALKGRAADGKNNACAWVNVLSIYALSNFPSHGTYSASKAAALSLSQCLRAEMASAGIRVINLFPGPIDDEWNQHMPPPKLATSALASTIVKALKDGVEDVYPGDVAQEWYARWQESPKVLEKELGA
jgi:NAD(P)-dependent dehydrogenase (short-subunit alcohol dehydrogenase family)/uncharacterized OB-fold protein